MTFSRRFSVCACSWLWLWWCSAACAQLVSPIGDGTGVEPRYLVPCGRTIALSDRPGVPAADEDSSRPAATPPAATPPAATSPAATSPAATPRRVEPATNAEPTCTSRSCQTCCAAPERPILAALERIFQRLFSCRRCARPSAEATPEAACTCTARPILASALPHLLRPNLPDPPHVEGDPFRDDSVQAPVFPQESRRQQLKPGWSVPLKAVCPQSAQSAAASCPSCRTEAVKLRVAHSEPRLFPAE